MVRIDDLRGKRVLVTGASSGIGAALSRAFAKQGAHVCIHYRNGASAAEELVEELRRSGATVVPVSGDLAEPDVPRRIVEEAAAGLGGLDILINNAGSLVERRPILEADDPWFDAVFDINARAVLRSCLSAVPHLERRPGAAIINVGSIAAMDGGGSGAGLYGAAKAFVHSLTRHLACELAARGIRVNTVAPGVVQTPFHALTPPERVETMRRSIPLGRLGLASDCVGAFLFLASFELSGYVTGQTLHINGGQFLA